MDVDKCVALHNKILEIGWLGSERSTEEFEQTYKSWFEFYGDEAEAVRDQLSPDLTAFLERAYDTGTSHVFTYYVSGLNCPDDLFEHATIFNENWSEDDKSRFVILYFMNSFASHPVGLVFDQHNSLAIICECIDDCGIICNGRMTWHPLQTVLEAWLDMIKNGKVIFSAENADEEKSWKIIPYSEQNLQEAVDVFNRLVDEIESRLPKDITRIGESSRALIEDATLNQWNLRQGFAYNFVRRAKSPRFRFIAPGLEIPDMERFAEQPFASVTLSGNVEAYPILLFRATDSTSKCIAPESEDSWFDRPFEMPFAKVTQYPAGLYLSCDAPSYYNAFEDECKLVLPFRIGAKGFARTSDGARFGEDTNNATEVIAHDTFVDLYQPGYNPFIKGHPRQLVHILKSWLTMVREGYWKVDGEGVVGGIEEWRNADTEEHWEKYVIPVTW